MCSYFTIVSDKGEEWTLELDSSVKIARVSDGMHVWVNTNVIRDSQSAKRLTVSLRMLKIELNSKDPETIGLVSSLKANKETFNFTRVKNLEAVELQKMFRRMSKCLTNFTKDVANEEKQSNSEFHFQMGRFRENLPRKRPASMSAVNPQSRKRRAHSGIEYED